MMYYNILNDLRTPVFLINKDNIVDYINSIGEEFFGISSTLIIGNPIHDFFPDDTPIISLL